MLRDLRDFQHNVYSQNGEDGVIEEILKRISKQTDLDKWCVEFGAWDGVYASNTCKLIRENQYSAVLIEGNPKKIDQCKKNFPQNDVVKICAFVGFEGKNKLDNILSETPIPADFDFLSIDIDGMDYHILDSVKKYTPKIICIEFNQTIPNVIDFVQPKSFDVKQGSSAKAISRLATEKGYDLVIVLSHNLILVRNDLTAAVINELPALEALHPLGNDPTYMFFGYDGTVLSNKDEIHFTWLGINAPMTKLQFFPKFLRTFPNDYSTLQRLTFWCFLFTHFPAKVSQHFWEKLRKATGK